MKTSSFLVAACVLPASLLGQSDKPGSKEMQIYERFLEEWSDRGAVIEKQIVEGDCRRAERSADSLLRDISIKLTGGPGAGEIVARPLRLRAVAEICQDKARLALWDLDVAGLLAPRGGDVHPASYGTLGQKIVDARKAAEHERAVKVGQYESLFGEGNPLPQKPELVAEREIEYPESLFRAMKSGKAIVTAFLDVDGELSKPEIATGSTQNPIFLHTVLDQLRHWKFRPATLDGRPVAIHYSLTVNFRRPF